MGSMIFHLLNMRCFLFTPLYGVFPFRFNIVSMLKRKIESLTILSYQWYLYSVERRTKSNDIEANTSKSYSSWINVWIEIPCSEKTLIGQIIIFHRLSIFENSKAWGKRVQVNVMEEWSKKQTSSDKIELAFVTIYFDICCKVFLKQVERKFFFYQNFSLASLWKIRSPESSHLKQVW